MADEEAGAPAGAPSNQTIQVDALTDVELVDDADGDGEDAPDGDAVGTPSMPGRAPPPLPPRRLTPAGIAAVVGAVLVMGALGGLGAHFLVPAAPHAPAPTPIVELAAPPAVEPPVEEPVIRHLRLDDEFIIGGPELDAGVAPPVAP